MVKKPLQVSRKPLKDAYESIYRYNGYRYASFKVMTMMKTTKSPIAVFLDTV